MSVLIHKDTLAHSMKIAAQTRIQIEGRLVEATTALEEAKKNGTDARTLFKLGLQQRTYASFLRPHR